MGAHISRKHNLYVPPIIGGKRVGVDALHENIYGSLINLRKKCDEMGVMNHDL